MSAQLKEIAQLRPMRAADLDSVMGIEGKIYSHPWTRGNFRDSLNAGYSCWIYELAGRVIGYAVMMVARDEAHLLNLSIAAEWQRQGWGKKLLRHLVNAASRHHAQTLLLEVRPSNTPGIKLYQAYGFRQIARR
ncbi:MAG: ribosomal protein S18-alanine N-acetyltransferase, partial [Burkholderiales bacterium]